MPHCPECLREFEVSGGFCPYDGATLKAGPPGQGPKAGDAQEQAAISRLRASGALHSEAEDEVDWNRLLGETLDERYRITRRLGEGGMGVVFFARHVVIEKPVAIKILKKQIGSDESVVKRFVQEAKAASRIGHPNIVNVTDFGTTPDGLTYQVMEFIDGKTLHEVLEAEKTIAVERGLRIVAQIARALGSAHDKGIVHRDLKPENVFLVDQQGRADFVKIVDFGIAKVASPANKTKAPRLTRAGSVFGTPEYMAPEQASGRSDIDARADVYSLGAMFYEMLTGQVPLSGETTVRTLAMVILDPVERPRTVNPALEISDEFEAVVMRALAKNREDRFESMEQFLSALERVAGTLAFTEKIAADSMGLPAMPPGSNAAPTDPDVDFKPPEPAKATEIDLHPAGAIISLGGMTAAEYDDDRKATTAYQRSKRPTHDPPFVVRARPGFDDIEEEFSFETKKSAWPIAIGLGLVLAGAAVAAFFVLSSGDKAAKSAGQTTIDAALPSAPRDAALAAVGIDAAATLESTPDAGGKAGVTKDPKTPRKKDPKKSRPSDLAKGEFRVTVFTNPPGGVIVLNGATTLNGDRATLDLARGQDHYVTCSKTGYLRSRVKIRSGTRSVVCTMRPGCDASDRDCVKDPYNR